MLKFAAVATTALLLCTPAYAREGFGFTKKAVTMNRKKPPTLNVGARRVKVSVTSERSQDQDDAATLKRYTEDTILNGAGTIAPDKDRGEIAIKITLDRVESQAGSKTKTESSYQKIGEKQVYNEKKKK